MVAKQPPPFGRRVWVEKALRKRQFGRTGWSVSEIGFGAWAIGASWGPVKDVDSLDALRVSLDEGVDFLDTADVYGDHASERLISRILKERKKQGKSVPIVAIRLCGHVRESDAGCGHGRRDRQDRCRAREDEISGRCPGGAPIFQRQASGAVCDRSFAATLVSATDTILRRWAAPIQSLACGHHLRCYRWAYRLPSRARAVSVHLRGRPRVPMV